ncbi:MAG TPA: hypothetical protein VGS12_11060 [Caulobacteraceae bacterium]|nr:hypothetical protein [Caulobacteraceae bacterium]
MPALSDLQAEVFACCLACGLDASDAGAVARLSGRAEAKVLVSKPDIIRRAKEMRDELIRRGEVWTRSPAEDPEDLGVRYGAARTLIAAGRTLLEELVPGLVIANHPTGRCAVHSWEIH